MTEQTQKKEQQLTPAHKRAREIEESRKSMGNWDGLNSRYPNIGKREGFVTHWFNDKAGRVEKMLELGWEFSKRAGFKDNKINLDKDPNARIRIHAGVKEDGSQLFQYAMDIPEEIYNKDRAKKMQSVDRKEQYIREGMTESDSSIKPDQVTSSIENHTLKPD